MNFLLGIIGIIGSIFMLKYREQVGNMIGEAEWMKKVGGVYNFIIILSIFFFFWSVAYITGTTDFFFGWFMYLIPGGRPQPPPSI